MFDYWFAICKVATHKRLFAIENLAQHSVNWSNLKTISITYLNLKVYSQTSGMKLVIILKYAVITNDNINFELFLILLHTYLDKIKYLRLSLATGIMFETLLGILLIIDKSDDKLPLLLLSNQSSINRAAAPLLSPLINEFVRLMEVPWVANQLKLPTGPHSSSTNFKRVISLSTSYLYLLRSAAGLLR